MAKSKKPNKATHAIGTLMAIIMSDLADMGMLSTFRAMDIALRTFGEEAYNMAAIKKPAKKGKRKP